MAKVSWELVSFNICPYVQRSVITLLVKRVGQFKLTSISLTNKPEWFLKISPFGKVPVLIQDEESEGGDKKRSVLFESAIINEYLDDVTGEPKLAPSTASLSSSPSSSTSGVVKLSSEALSILFLKSSNKSWIEYCNSALMTDVWQATSLAASEKDFSEKIEQLLKKLDHIETHSPRLIQLPYFNGEKFSLVDSVYAPFFQRLAHLSSILLQHHSSSPSPLPLPILTAERFPLLSQWSANLLQRSEISLSSAVLLELISPQEAVDLLTENEESNQKRAEVVESTNKRLDEEYEKYWKQRNSWFYNRYWALEENKK